MRYGTNGLALRPYFFYFHALILLFSILNCSFTLHGMAAVIGAERLGWYAAPMGHTKECNRLGVLYTMIKNFVLIFFFHPLSFSICSLLSALCIFIATSGRVYHRQLVIIAVTAVATAADAMAITI